MTLASAPSPDELELSLFGPGVGECAVVHLGAGDWLVVDSCIDPLTRRPVALAYLEAIGVDPTAIRSVVVTHWHDDHIRGASAVLNAAQEATFSCSAVLRTAEFKQFVAASRAPKAQGDGTSGVDEFASIVRVLQRRNPGVRFHAVSPTWASANTLLFRRSDSTVGPISEVFSLSPSAGAISRGFHALAQFLPRRGAPKRAAVSIEPNETSVVLSVRVGDVYALLGSDLETGASPAAGWGAVMTTLARPSAPAHVFKVPHHGSANAHHDPVWATALVANVTAALTPFARGRQPLPMDGDVHRIKQQTDRLFITSPRPARVTFADPMVQKTVREATKDIRPRVGKMGHVRIRLAATNLIPHVELFGAAFAA